MARKKPTRQETEEALRRTELERYHLQQILNALIRGVKPTAVEVAPIYSPALAGEREAECRMGLFGATRANGGLVLIQYTYSDGSMRWQVCLLDSKPFPALIEYHECRGAWDRLLEKRRAMLDAMIHED